MTRRELLAVLTSTLLQAEPSTVGLPLSSDDDKFLDDLSRRAFLYFIDHWHPVTGLYRDRARTDGNPVRRADRFDIASIAATGFGLTALCIGVERGWISRPNAEGRVEITLRYLTGKAKRKNGWYYHFCEISNGERRWLCEASSIDTALLMGGVLTARQYFASNAEIVKLSEHMYAAMDFRWMLNKHPHLFSHGWFPETGFIPYRWDKYSEETILYLLGIGAPNKPITPESWWAWTRPFRRYGPYIYLGAVGPVFIHQYSHAWVDYRRRRENRYPNVNYFENSVNATRAHRDFCMALGRTEFPKSYSPDFWGITASDSAKGYSVWGGPPPDMRIDGTLVPCGPGGSLMFTPDISLPALRAMKKKYGERIYGKYGFADAFNPSTDWISSDVIGIDQGIILLSAENLRSGNVWKWFMANPEIPKAMTAIGLDPEG